MATVKLHPPTAPKTCFPRSLLRLVQFLFALLLLLNIGWLFHSVDSLKMENRILRNQLESYIETQDYNLQIRRQNFGQRAQIMSDRINSQAQDILEIKEYLDKKITELTERLDIHEKLTAEKHRLLAEREQVQEKKLEEVSSKRPIQNNSVIGKQTLEEVKTLVKTAANQEISEIRALYDQINTRVEEIRLEVFVMSGDMAAIVDGSHKKIKDKKQMEILLNSYVSKESLRPILDRYSKRMTELNNELKSHEELIKQMDEEINRLRHKGSEGLFDLRDEFLRNINNCHSFGASCRKQSDPRSKNSNQQRRR